MRNPAAGYKHSDPTHLQFGQSADSSLLAKRRQGFARGGSVEDSADEDIKRAKGARERAAMANAEILGQAGLAAPKTQDMLNAEAQEGSAKTQGLSNYGY